MAKTRVLWIEDSAHNENTILAVPVHLSGRYDLTIALNATDGMAELLQRDYEVVVVDIRIPPGEDPRWLKIYYYLFNSKKPIRLGLRLLQILLGDPDPLWNDNFPAAARDPSRFGVLSVETRRDLADDLANLRVTVCRDKGDGEDPAILLDTIEMILTKRGASDIDRAT